MNSVTFQNGNKEVTVTAGKGSVWIAGDNKRVYFDTISSDKKRNPIPKIAKIIFGSAKTNPFEHKIEVEGHEYIVELAGCDSNTKRKAALEAAHELVKGL